MAESEHPIDAQGEQAVEMFRALVIREHVSDEELQLNLKLGDVVAVLEEDASGWAGGRKVSPPGEEAVGWFPRYCVQPMGPSTGDDGAGAPAPVGASAPSPTAPSSTEKKATELVLEPDPIETKADSPIRGLRSVATPQQGPSPTRAQRASGGGAVMEAQATAGAADAAAGAVHAVAAAAAEAAADAATARGEAEVARKEAEALRAQAEAEALQCRRAEQRAHAAEQSLASAEAALAQEVARREQAERAAEDWSAQAKSAWRALQEQTAEAKVKMEAQLAEAKAQLDAAEERRRGEEERRMAAERALEAAQQEAQRAPSQPSAAQSTSGGSPPRPKGTARTVGAPQLNSVHGGSATNYHPRQGGRPGEAPAAETAASHGPAPSPPAATTSAVPGGWRAWQGSAMASPMSPSGSSVQVVSATPCTSPTLTSACYTPMRSNDLAQAFFDAGPRQHAPEATEAPRAGSVRRAVRDLEERVVQTSRQSSRGRCPRRSGPAGGTPTGAPAALGRFSSPAAPQYARASVAPPEDLHDELRPYTHQSFGMQPLVAPDVTAATAPIGSASSAAHC